MNVKEVGRLHVSDDDPQHLKTRQEEKEATHSIVMKG